MGCAVRPPGSSPQALYPVEQRMSPVFVPVPTEGPSCALLQLCRTQGATIAIQQSGALTRDSVTVSN